MERMEVVMNAGKKTIRRDTDRKDILTAAREPELLIWWYPKSHRRVINAVEHNTWISGYERRISVPLSSLT